MWTEILSALNAIFSIASLATSWYKYFQYTTLNKVANAIQTTEQRVRMELRNNSSSTSLVEPIGVDRL